MRPTGVHRALTHGGVIALTLLAVTGCGPYRTYDGPKLPESQVALIWPSVQGVPAIKTVDGRPVDLVWHTVLAVRPGAHVLGLRVRWSNGFTQDVELPVELAAGTRCLLKVYEGEPPKPPPKPLTPLEAVGAGAVAGVVGTAMWYTVPFWGPPALAIWALKPKPTAPPKGHGLIVWVDSGGRSIAEWKSEWGTPRGTALTRVD